MRTYAIVVIHILGDELAQFPRSVILVRVKLLRLEAAEPSLYHDVVGPLAAAVHALPDAIAAKQLFVFLACELAALIRVDDGRDAVFLNSLPHCLYDVAYLDCLKGDAQRCDGCASR